MTGLVRRRRTRRNRVKGWLYALAGARPCPLCGGQAWPAGASWMHAHLRCSRCHLIYVAELPPVHCLEAAYDRVHQSGYQVSHKQDWAPWMQHKHHSLDALGVGELEARPGGPGRSLDVGCGEGAMLQVLEERGWEGWGLELNAVLADQARARGLRALVGSFEAPRLPPEMPGAFNLVVMNHIIEHLRRPLAALTRARSLLAPGGRLVLETPVRPDFDNIDHLYCFSPAALDLALRQRHLCPRRWLDYVDDNYHHHNLACLAAGGEGPVR